MNTVWILTAVACLATCLPDTISVRVISLKSGTPADQPSRPEEAAKRTTANGTAVPAGVSVRAYHVC